MMTATATYLNLRALLDEFARCGMRTACATPGSRNTPIVLSLAAEPRINTHSLIDERSAGFFALGAAKQSRLPALVTCTSGTAAANLLPAVLEAHEAGVPLIVLTADRPPELRDVGAGQTIDQIKLYGDAVKWFCEVGVPEAGAAQLRWIRSLACRAYWTAISEFPGPVHLNLPLREPLVLDQPLPSREPGGGGRSDGRPWVSQCALHTFAAPRPDVNSVTAITERSAVTAPAPPAQFPTQTKPSLFAPRAVIVAGETTAGHEFGAELAALAAQLEIPLLADPRSGARRGGAAIAHYDLLLRDSTTARTYVPDYVYRIGDLPTSKPLRSWLAKLGTAHQISLCSDMRWTDPAAMVSERWLGAIDELLPRIAEVQTGAPQTPWLAAWRTADQAIADAIRRPLTAGGLCEPAIAQTLSHTLGPDAVLFVAASMPVRDIEMLFEVRDRPPRVLANRGANGIDGTVSAAFGAASAAASMAAMSAAAAAARSSAAAKGPEVVLLTGDVTLAHDLSGLLCATRNSLKLTIVLLNNGGGSIFDFLPVATAAPAADFERLIATPPGISFEKAAALFGLGHTRPNSLKAFQVALEQALAGETSTIIEIRSDRPRNLQLHRDLEFAALDALQKLFL